MSKYRYAAYGSNLHPLRLQRRVPSARLLGSSPLPGFQLRFNKKSDVDDSGKCGINETDSIVYVAIYEIARAEQADLDRFEGLGTGYERVTVFIEGYGHCSTYVADPAAIDETLLPMDWYKEMVLLGCLWNGFPDDYIEHIESTHSIQDPDQHRARENWQIVSALRKYR